MATETYKNLKLREWAAANNMNYQTAWRKYRQNKVPGAYVDDVGHIRVKQSVQIEVNEASGGPTREIAVRSAYSQVPKSTSLESIASADTRLNRSGFQAPFGRYANIDNSFLPFINFGGSKNADGNWISIKDIVVLCQKAYFNFSVVRNVIDIMTEFSCNNIHFKGGTAKSRKFFAALFSEINIKNLQDKFFREYYRSGNVFLYRIDGKLKPSDVAGIMNKYSDVSVAAAGGSINLPLKYIILNPADIILSNSSSIGTGSFYKMLSDFEVAILSNPKTEQDKMLLNSLDKEARDAISQSRSSKGKTQSQVLLKLNPEYLYGVFYKKQDYEPFGVSMVFPVLDDLEWKIELKRMDQAIARTVQQAVLLVTFGYESKNGEYMYDQRVAEALQSIFANESVGRVLIADWTTKAEFVIPDIGDILDPQKYNIVNEEIRSGLNDILFGGEGEKFANQQIKTQVFVERLRSGQEAFISQFLMPEIKRISDIMKFQSYPTPSFQEFDLRNQEQFNRIYTQLAQIGVLTPEETIKAIETGVLPDAETSVENQRKFKSLKDSGLYEPLVGGPKEKEEGRPGGTTSQQTTKKVGPIGGSADVVFSCLKLKENLKLANDTKIAAAEFLKKKYKLKKLSDVQEKAANDILDIILANEAPQDWEKSINKYFQNPVDQDKNNANAILDIMSKHQVDFTTGALLFHSIK